MPRWLRTLFIALLLPAYSLAAVGVCEYLPVVAGVGAVQIEGDQNPASFDEGLAGHVEGLVLELGDTSDDAAELPTPVPSHQYASPAPEGVSVYSDDKPPISSAERLLRPPKLVAQGD
jgi:hypothetical protein